MDEDFIQKALHMMGEVNLLSIKIVTMLLGFFNFSLVTVYCNDWIEEEFEDIKTIATVSIIVIY